MLIKFVERVTWGFEKSLLLGNKEIIFMIQICINHSEAASVYPDSLASCYLSFFLWAFSLSRAALYVLCLLFDWYKNNIGS